VLGDRRGGTVVPFTEPLVLSITVGSVEALTPLVVWERSFDVETGNIVPDSLLHLIVGLISKVELFEMLAVPLVEFDGAMLDVYADGRFSEVFIRVATVVSANKELEEDSASGIDLVTEVVAEIVVAEFVDLMLGFGWVVELT
jgi:hypothetical protein